MEFKSLILNKEAGIATITLNRPDKLNSLTVQILTEFSAAIDDVAKDDNIRVLVITGAGRAFCAGADLGHPLFKETSAVKIYKGLDKFHDIPLKLRALPKPVIACVNGSAVGAGANIALACDIIIAAEGARFGQVFINIGIHVDTGGTYFLPRSIGIPKAIELMMTGDLVEAKEAERIGMINRVVPSEKLHQVTTQLAQKLANGPPVALALIKASVYDNLTRDLSSALQREASCQAILLNSDDNKEGISAFLEKRKPMFKGS